MPPTNAGNRERIRGRGGGGVKGEGAGGVCFFFPFSQTRGGYITGAWNHRTGKDAQARRPVANDGVYYRLPGVALLGKLKQEVINSWLVGRKKKFYDPTDH